MARLEKGGSGVSLKFDDVREEEAICQVSEGGEQEQEKPEEEPARRVRAILGRLDVGRSVGI